MTPLKGQLGYTIGGEYRVLADEGRFYVRFPDQSFAAALHRGRVPPLPDLPVLVTSTPAGDLVIVGTDPDQIEAFGGAVDVGIHSHARFSGLEFAIDDRLWLKLAARILDGLRVEVTPGRYDADGALRWWDGGTLDLAPYRPPTANHHRWCVIGIDPALPSLVAVGGASQPVALPLLPAQIAVVPFAWERWIALCAVRLRQGQTALFEDDFEALLATASTPGLHPDRLLTDGDAPLLDAAGNVLWG